MTSTRRLATVPSPEVARMTRPFPCRGLFHHARANGVKMDVPCDRPEIGLVFDQFSPVTALEDMSVEAVSSRPSVGVSRKKALHSSARFGSGVFRTTWRWFDMTTNAPFVRGRVVVVAFPRPSMLDFEFRKSAS
jgi:hypothetical protein